MTPLQFGRRLKTAFELSPQPKAPAAPKAPVLSQTPPAPSVPKPAAPQQQPNQQRTWSNFWTGTHNPSQPTAYDDYRRTLSRYISPWNQDTSGSQGNDQGATDAALKWGTRAALGTGAAAGGAAVGVAAGAPALAATPVSSVPAALSGSSAATGTAAAGAGAAATQNPNVQRLFPTATNAVSTAANAFNRTTTDAAMQVNDLKSTLWGKLPHQARQFHETIEHSPFSQALDPSTGVSKAMNPLNTSGNLTGLLPHSVVMPYEGAHEGAHALEHTLHGLTGGESHGVQAGMH